MPKPAARSNRSLLILMVTMMVVVAVAVVVMWNVVAAGPRDQVTQNSGGISIGGPFTLTDQTGKTVNEHTYDGSYRLIYFGYTFCPDACPAELQVMAQAVDTMGTDGAKVQLMFITIDPTRDTQAQLAKYVPLFDKRMAGLTGTAEQIAAVAKAYKVYYSKAPATGSDPSAYGMNHSSFVYLMDPNDKFLTVFSSDTDSDKMAADIKGYIEKAKS